MTNSAAGRYNGGIEGGALHAGHWKKHPRSAHPEKLSQDHLAQVLHVTRQTVSNYETGRSRPDVEMLAALAQALDTDVKELLCVPAHREARLRRLRRLTVSAVATALAGALDAVDFLWGRHLMEAFYIGRVYYAAVYLLHPLFTLLLGRTLALGLLGRPVRRAGSPSENPDTEKSDSPE